VGRSDAKILIFVQFRAMMKIFKRIFAEEKWKCVTFEGTMDVKARNLAIQQFTDDPDTKVMISALEAGGVGLNLVAANRVLIGEVWLNRVIDASRGR
jgi:SNF2 family DNA or RNA helicase